MDFNPSAYSVSLATAQSSLNFYHLNLKCCCSFAYLPLIIEPVAMAKYLNALQIIFTQHTRSGSCVHSFVPSLKKHKFLHIWLSLLKLISQTQDFLFSCFSFSSNSAGRGSLIFHLTPFLKREGFLSVILSVELHGSQKLWPCLERKCTRHTDKRGPALRGRTLSL